MAVPAYRCLLRTLYRTSVNERAARAPHVQRSLRSLLPALTTTQVDSLVTFMRAHRTHQELVQRYNPGGDMSEPERIRATANRVGLNVPKTVDLESYEDKQV